MIMVSGKGGLLVFLMITSSAFGMEEREAMENIPYEQLKARWDAVIQEQENFNNLHGDAWRTNPVLKREKDRLQSLHRKYMNAIMNSDHTKDLVRPHGVSRNTEATGVPSNKRSFEEIFQNNVVRKNAKKLKETLPEVPSAIAQKSSAKVVQQILNSYEELWGILLSEAQGKQGEELAIMADKLDCIEDHKTALWERFNK